MITLVFGALRALEAIIPALLGDGKGAKLSALLNTITTLGERGAEGYGELKDLTAKLEAMDGVSAADRDAIMATIEDQHKAIQDAAKLI